MFYIKALQDGALLATRGSMYLYSKGYRRTEISYNHSQTFIKIKYTFTIPEPIRCFTVKENLISSTVLRSFAKDNPQENSYKPFQDL